MIKEEEDEIQGVRVEEQGFFVGLHEVVGGLWKNRFFFFPSREAVL